MATIDEAMAVAIAEHRAGRHDAAATLYRRVLAVHPGHANALHLLGLTERHAGRASDGISLIQKALGHDPFLIEARLNLANILLAIGDGNAAQAQWRAIQVIDPTNAAALHSLGTNAAGHGGAGRPWAIRSLRRALALSPDAASIWHDLGLLLRQDEQVDAAIDCQRRAIALHPGFLSAWMNLGNALLEAGDAAGAMAALRHALVMAPDTRECWYNLGNARYRTGDLDGALACYQRSAILGLPAARARVVAVLVDLGRDAAAEAALGRYLPLDGTDVSTCIELLHSMMVRARRQADARVLFTRLASLPLAGRLYPTECRTALAALDMDAGDAPSAVARLDNIRSDNCWMFTVRSLAGLRCSLDTRGLSLPRRANPHPEQPRLTSTTLGNRGRFAHNALEYVLMRLYAEKHGCTLETPDWVGGVYFDLDDPVPGTPLPPWPFGRRVLNNLLTGASQDEPVINRDVLSPLFLFDYKVEYRDRVRSWLRPRACWAPWIDPAVTALRAAGATIVALHIRRGDFVQYGYPITQTQWYVDWLRDLWPTLDRPVLFLASDDLQAVRSAFAEFNPLTLAEIAPPWPNLDYLQDFHVLTQADIVGISTASGFSQLAARLNERARLCVEPDVAAGCIRPFVPWS